MNKRTATLLFRVLVAALLFTGFAQMPIFARYYLADVPGFGWTADYHLNHILHYSLAILLLLWLGWRAPLALRRPLSIWRLLIALSWAGIVLTGLVRVAKNQPDVFFSPTTVMIVDWSHLGLVMLLGVLTLLRPRSSRVTV